MQRPGDEMGSFAAICGVETASNRQSNVHVFDIAPLLRAYNTTYNYGVWVVGAVGDLPKIAL
jgi:hypothetical protein